MNQCVVHYSVSSITSACIEPCLHLRHEELHLNRFNISFSALEKFVLDTKRITGLIAVPNDGKM